jgi:Fic family protein
MRFTGNLTAIYLTFSGYLLPLNMAFSPKFTITPKLLSLIADIEVSRQSVVNLPITAHMLSSLRETARLMATHYSTAIEGNRLSQAEVREVIAGGGNFPNREKDEREVRNYYKALDYVEQLASKKGKITETHIRTIHGITFKSSERPTPYRDEQNVIREGPKGLVVYIPPKANDVPLLMKDLVNWINQQVGILQIPLIAGLAHYEIATIHPYFDGNGRTARLLTTLILHKYGYGLRSIYSLEEYYARDLPAYYSSLSVGSDEDYYDGNRAKADLTRFLEFFIAGMADSFAKIRIQAEKARDLGYTDQSSALRSLNSQQRQLLRLFLNQVEITAKDVAEYFSLSPRQARNLCKKWTESYFLEISDPAPKTRKYRLVEKYEKLIQEQIREK